MFFSSFHKKFVHITFIAIELIFANQQTGINVPNVLFPEKNILFLL